MQSNIVRAASRLSTRTAFNPSLSRHVTRRTYASESPGPVYNDRSSPDTHQSPGGSYRRSPYVFGIGAVVFVMVAGRYILASSKEAGSGHREQQEIRRRTDPSKEFRDPRDSGVKTLKQKQEKADREAKE